MSKKNDIEVIINSKRYTLSGYESEEYLQRVAGFINSKIVDLKHQDFYKHMDADMRNILIQLNLADDYFKMKKLMEEVESDGNSKNSEIFSLKHELVDLQTKLGTLNAEMKALRESLLDEQKKNIRLETELSESRKKGNRQKQEKADVAQD